jgi:hypothetical protein
MERLFLCLNPVNLRIECFNKGCNMILNSTFHQHDLYSIHQCIKDGLL